MNYYTNFSVKRATHSWHRFTFLISPQEYGDTLLQTRGGLCSQATAVNRHRICCPAPAETRTRKYAIKHGTRFRACTGRERNEEVSDRAHSTVKEVRYCTAQSLFEWVSSDSQSCDSWTALHQNVCEFASFGFDSRWFIVAFRSVSAVRCPRGKPARS